MSNMREYIDERMSGFCLNEQTKCNVLDSVREEELTPGQNKQRRAKNNRRYIMTRRRFVALGAAICLVCTGSITALATVSPNWNDLIYQFSPAFAQRLYPVNKSAEDQGIKVTILSAVNDEHNAVVYFTVQDVQGKGRVSQSLDFCDDYRIQGPSTFGVLPVSYDEETQTGLFALLGNNADNMAGKMNQLDIGSMMFGKVKTGWFDSELELNQLLPEAAEKGRNQTVSSEEVCYNGGNELTENFRFLKPDVLNIPVKNAAGIFSVTNIGFVDGKLHLQTKWEPSMDNVGLFRLVSGTPEIKEFDMETAFLQDAVDALQRGIDCSNYYFSTAEDDENTDPGKRQVHIEYVFDVGSPEELSQYDLWTYLVEDGTVVNGNWNIGFRTEEARQVTVETQTAQADAVEVSSMGVYVKGYGGTVEECKIKVLMKDGTSISDFWVQSSSAEDIAGGAELCLMFAEPVDLVQVAAVSLNGELLSVQ